MLFPDDGLSKEEDDGDEQRETDGPGRNTRSEWLDRVRAQTCELLYSSRTGTTLVCDPVGLCSPCSLWIFFFSFFIVARNDERALSAQSTVSPSSPSAAESAVHASGQLEPPATTPDLLLCIPLLTLARTYLFPANSLASTHAATQATMPPRKAPKTYVCIVCGAPATSRCPPCWDAGIVTPFCSRDHQKLVSSEWRLLRSSSETAHAATDIGLFPSRPGLVRTSGFLRRQRLPVPAAASQRLGNLARSHLQSRTRDPGTAGRSRHTADHARCFQALALTVTLRKQIKGALAPDMRRDFPSSFRVSVTDVRADITAATVDKNQDRLSVSVPTYTASRWLRQLFEMQDNGDLADDEFSDEVLHLFQILATLLYLGQKPLADRPKAFRTDFIVDVVKRILETLAHLHEVGQSIKLLKVLKNWVKPVANLQGEIGRGDNGMTGRVEIYSVGR